MELTLNNMKKVFSRQEVKDIVSAWLLQKAFAQTMREKINEIYSAVLREIPVYTDNETLRKYHPEELGKQIFDVNDLYLCDNNDLCQKVYDEAERREELAGLRKGLKPGYCPALTAESKLTEIEHEIVKLTGHPFDITADKIWSNVDGLKNWQKWIDLAVGAVVSQPDFKHPLKG